MTLKLGAKTYSQSWFCAGAQVAKKLMLGPCQVVIFQENTDCTAALWF